MNECPLCKSKRSVRIRNNRYECVAPNCKFIQFSPMTFQNQINNFQGEHTHQLRFGGTYNDALENGGLDIQFAGKGSQELNKLLKLESKRDNQYKEFQSNIRKLCYRMKIHDKFKQGAIQKYKYILKKVEQSQRDKIGVQPKQLAAFCLYCAFTQQDMFEMEQKVKKKARITQQTWKNIKKKIKQIAPNSRKQIKPSYLAQLKGKQFGLSSQAIKKVKQILNLIQQFQIADGEAAKTIAASALQIYCEQQGNKQGNFKIRELFGITAQTIRKFCSKIKQSYSNYEQIRNLFNDKKQIKQQ